MYSASSGNSCLSFATARLPLVAVLLLQMFYPVVMMGLYRTRLNPQQHNTTAHHARARRERRMMTSYSKYLCLSCGLSSHHRNCEKCGEKGVYTGNRGRTIAAKGKNKTKKRQRKALQARYATLNHKEPGLQYHIWQRKYLRYCGLHSDSGYRYTNASTIICPICNKVVWQAEGLY